MVVAVAVVQETMTTRLPHRVQVSQARGMMGEHLMVIVFMAAAAVQGNPGTRMAKVVVAMENNRTSQVS